MESKPQNPDFRNNPENFHPWDNPGFIILQAAMTRLILRLI